MDREYPWTWTVFDLYVSMKCNNRERVEQLKNNILAMCNSEDMVEFSYGKKISGDDRVNWVKHYVPVEEPDNLLQMYRYKVLENKERLQKCYKEEDFVKLCNYWCPIKDVVKFTNSLTCDVGCYLEANRFLEPEDLECCVSCSYYEVMQPTTQEGIERSLFDPYIVDVMESVMKQMEKIEQQGGAYL